MPGEDYGKATGAPSRIAIGGVDRRVAKLGPRIYGELTQFLKSYVPDPRLKAAEILAKLPGVSNEVGLRIWEDFQEEAAAWPPSLDSLEGNVLLTTTYEGAKQVIWSLLRHHDAAMTPEEAGRLAETVTIEEVAELIRLAMPERDFSPKSPGDRATATSTPDRGPVPA